jgi:hypothetical protein
MESRTDLEQQLWELVYDLLSDEQAEALRQRITSEPEVARCYAEVQLQAELLAEAMRIEAPAIALQRPAGAETGPARVAPPGDKTRPSLRPRTTVRVVNWLVSLAAALLVCLCGYWVFRPDSPLRETAAAPADGLPPGAELRTVVYGPARLKSRLPNYFTVVTETSADAARPTLVSYRLFDAQDRPLADGTAPVDSGGVAQIATPRELRTPEVRLQVAPAIPGAEVAPVQLSLPVARDDLVAFVRTDKAAYQPGDAVRFRAVALAPFGRAAADPATVDLSVQAAEGAAVSPAAGRTLADGVVAGEFPLAAKQAEGRYDLVARSPRHRFAETRKEFAVERYEALPQRAMEERADSFEAADKKSRPDPTVQFFTESGQLVAGVRNRVYVASRTGQGQPLPIAGRLCDENDRVVAAVQTTDRGRGRVEFVPETGRAYRLVVDQPSGAAKAFPLTAPSGADAVTLIPESDAFAPQTPVVVRLYSAQVARPLAIAARYHGAVVAQEMIAAERFQLDGDGHGSCAVSLDVDPQAVGVIRVTAYDYEVRPPQVVAERLVFRRPERKLDIRLSRVPQDAAPGKEVRMSVSVTDEQGQPQPATLGLVVAVESSFGASQLRQPSLAAQYWLASELRSGDSLDDADFYLRDEPAAARELDCLLGTAGRRLGASADYLLAQNKAAMETKLRVGGVADEFLAENKPDTEAGRRLAVPEAPAVAASGSPQMLADRVSAIRSVVGRPAGTLRELRESAVNQAGRVLAFASLGLWIAVAVVVVLRLTSGARVWGPVLSVATAGLLIGCLWMRAEVDETGQLALLPDTTPSRAVALGDRPEELLREEQAASADPAQPRGERLAEKEMDGAHAAAREATSVPAAGALAQTASRTGAPLIPATAAPSAAQDFAMPAAEAPAPSTPLAPPAPAKVAAAAPAAPAMDKGGMAAGTNRVLDAPTMLGKPAAGYGGYSGGRAGTEDRSPRAAADHLGMRQSGVRKDAEETGKGAGEKERLRLVEAKLAKGESATRGRGSSGSIAADVVEGKMARRAATAPIPALGAAGPGAPAAQESPPMPGMDLDAACQDVQKRGVASRAAPAKPQGMGAMGGGAAGSGRPLARSQPAPEPARDQQAHPPAKAAAAPAEAETLGRHDNAKEERVKSLATETIERPAKPAPAMTAGGAPIVAAKSAGQVAGQSHDEVAGEKAVGTTAAAAKRLEKSALGYGLPLAATPAPADGKPAAPQVLYWNPRLVADERGGATFAFQLPATPAAVRILVDGHTADRIGSVTEAMSVRATAK